MNLKKWSIALGSFLLIHLFSCQEKKALSPSIFEMLSPGQTGIEFNNIVEENDSFHIMEEQYMYNGGGVGLGDFNNDNLLDIFFTGNLVNNKLYLNKGGFKFEDISSEAGIEAPETWSSGATVVDINNDGWLDIYVAATFHKDSSNRENKLFVNLGLNDHGVPQFEDQAKQYGIADSGYSTNGIFFDYDLDGDLDLYVLQDVLIEREPSKLYKKINDGTSLTNDQLYRNNGNNTFTNVTVQAGILIEGYGLGIAVMDINKDDYPDLYISNDFVTNDVLWINNQDGTFSNQISQYFKHQSHSSMGNDAADFNHDGYLDFMTLDMLPASNQREKQMFGAANFNFQTISDRINYEIQYTRNCLQLNNGYIPQDDQDAGSAFSDIAQMTGIHNTDWSWSILFADYDNDGLKDISITNGFPRDVTDLDFSDYRLSTHRMFDKTQQMLEQIPVVKIKNYFYKNNGNLQFDDVSEDWGISSESFSNGSAFGDLDNDGDLDFIVNNINDPAHVFENKSRQLLPENNYFKIKLKGSTKNINGLGAKLWLSLNDRLEYYEHTPYRGYISSIDPIIHFGLGKTSQIEELTIQWPDGKGQILENIEVNQTLTLDYAQAKEIELPYENTKTLFKEIASEKGLDFIHQETPFFEHKVQPLVPHGFANEGPGIAVGDVNGDGLEDCFFGNARGKNGFLYLQEENGSFKKAGLADVQLNEDQGVLLFDADQDNDLDLYIASGSSEFEARKSAYQDFLFFNDGQGNFKVDTTALPDLYIASSTVNAADFDRDGDLDLFIGGRLLPQSYPLPESSHILENQGGKFTIVSTSVCPELQNIGLVTDALWTDFDSDGWQDLILVGEWMPITLFKNQDGQLSRLEAAGLENTEGWWRSISSGDFDQDGDIDYILGNQGLNNRYQASKEYPLRMVAKDFDGNNQVDNFMSAYREGDYYPVHLRNDAIAQLNYLRKRFQRYEEYGKAKMTDVLRPEELKEAYNAQTCVFETSYLENLGDGNFQLQALPVQAQTAPVFGTLIDDFNNDGYLDVLAIGNNYQTEVFNGRHDAFNGLLLQGDGQGEFKAVPYQQSGFIVAGSGKALVQLFDARNHPLLIATQNNGPLRAFSYSTAQGGQLIPVQTNDCKAEIQLKNGKKVLKEIYYGSAYLSHSSRSFILDIEQVESIQIIDYQGNKRQIDLKQSI